MELFKTMIGGLLEGLTSALPLSESAHRLLFEKFAKTTLPAGLSLAVAVAICLVFHRTLWECIKGLGKMIGGAYSGKFRWRKASRYQKMAVFAPIAAVPYWILVALQAHFGFVEGVGQNLLLAGGLLIANAGLLFIGDHSIEKHWDATDLTFGHTLKLGLFQAVSVLPGFSRTAMTLCMARNMGYKAKAAMEFSFMTAIPALLGGALIQGGIAWSSLAAMAAALVGAVLGLLLVKLLIQKEKVYWLMYYSAAVGVAAIILNFI